MLLFLWSIASTADAVNFDLKGVNFGINGYMDIQYKYVTKQTKSDGTLAKDKSTFQQKQMNLIFDMEKDRFRTHLNFESHNAYTSDDGGKGEWELENVFGQYTFSDRLIVKGGEILTPFGLYNETRYITSLYASVLLPLLYAPPGTYSEESLVPDKANVVISGSIFGDTTEVNYNFYISNGERNDEGEDENKDKGYGTRIRLTFDDTYKLGISYYTSKNHETTEGRQQLWGIDIEIPMIDERLLLEGEFVRDEYKKRADRTSYYVRLTYRVDNYSPFVVYDYLEDPDDLAMKNKLSRYGVGMSYDVSTNLILKGEYHYSAFAGDTGLLSDTDTAHMVKMAAIFVF